MFNNELWQKPTAAGAAGFYTHQIANSVRVENSSANSTATNYFYRDGDAGNRDTWTLGMWIKRARISTSNSHTSMSTWGGHSGSGSGRGYGMVNDYTGTINGMSFEDNNGSSWHLTTRTSAVYRDLSAWTHVCWRYDSTQSTEADRARMYVNGELITDLQATTYPAQNADHSWNSGGYQFIGCNLTASNGNNPHQGFDGYIAEVISIDGTSLDPMDNLVETKNGVIIPKDPSGLTFGTNGFWLKFTNSSALGEDFSGNDNDFTVAGIAAHDQLTDTPTFNSNSNGGNYCTLNPLFPDPTIARITNGNLEWGGSAGGGSVNEMGCMSTFAISPSDTNIYYFEARMKTGYSGGIEQSVGVNVPTVDLTSDRGGRPTAWAITNGDDQRIYNGANSYTNTGVAGSAGDIVGVEIDRANTTIKFYIDGTLIGSATNLNTTTDLYPWVGTGGSTSDALGWDMNFGQNGTFNGLETAQGESDATGYGDFYYDEANSCKALCAGNLSVADAVDPAQTDDDYPQKMFQSLTYTGNANNSRTITTEFDPDVMWFKRYNGSKAWNNYSKTQGIGDTSYYQQFDSTAYDGYNSGSYKGVISTASTSMTIGAVDYINGSSMEYVSYLFNMGGSQATNNDGSVTSYIYNSGAGMSVGKYTGESATRTVGHGLGVAPSFIIVKSIGAARNWAVYYGDTGKALQLNNTNAADTGSYWNSTAPTSSVFTVADVSETGKSEQYMFMAFANTEGFIKAGTYLGNGNADGTFVYTGFRPAFILYKATNAAQSWVIIDNARNTYNPSAKGIFTESSIAESDSTVTYGLDILSNGFKMRGTNNVSNGSYTYLYLAMAKNPFKYATAR